MENVDDALITTPLILAELDHLLSVSGGAKAAHGLREDLSSGAYQVEWWPSALEDTIAASRRYDTMDLGLADASLVALARHLDTTNVATLDERHFRVIRPLSGRASAFTLLPADAG